MRSKSRRHLALKLISVFCKHQCPRFTRACDLCSHSRRIMPPCCYVHHCCELCPKPRFSPRLADVLNQVVAAFAAPISINQLLMFVHSVLFSLYRRSNVYAQLLGDGQHGRIPCETVVLDRAPLRRPHFQEYLRRMVRLQDRACSHCWPRVSSR